MWGGQSGFFWGGGVESVSVCTHHVQQKRRLIQLIYTMHRVLFTRDIPTEGLSLVLLQSPTGHTQTRTFLFVVVVLPSLRKKAKWQSSGTFSLQPSTERAARKTKACLLHVCIIFYQLLLHLKYSHMIFCADTYKPRMNSANIPYFSDWETPSSYIFSPPPYSQQQEWTQAKARGIILSGLQAFLPKIVTRVTTAPNTQAKFTQMQN